MGASDMKDTGRAERPWVGGVGDTVNERLKTSETHRQAKVCNPVIRVRAMRARPRALSIGERIRPGRCMGRGAGRADDGASARTRRPGTGVHTSGTSTPDVEASLVPPRAGAPSTYRNPRRLTRDEF